LTVASFFFGATLPWADAWIGVPYYQIWQRSHSAGFVYRTVSVEGYLRTDNFAGTDGVPSPSARYQYVETRGGMLSIDATPVAGNYIEASVLPAPNDECVESTEAIVLYLRRIGWPMDNDEHCLKLVGRDEPISRYALEMERFADRPEMRTLLNRMPWHRVNDGFFRIYGQQHRIVDRETGELLAEAWDSVYMPWFSHLTGLPRYVERARSLAPPQTRLHPTAILIPQSPTQDSER
jgi:hypothetical protein